MATPIRILLADDHTVVRMGIAAVLSLDPALLVVAEAEDGLTTMEQYRLTRPDVVLLDLRMPGMDGLTALKGLREEFPEIKALVLTTSELVEDMRQARKAGALGYLRKNVPRAELIHAIQEVHAGRHHVSLEIDRRIEEDSRRRQFTERELEVLDCLRRGLSNQEISRALSISEGTAQNYVLAIQMKLEAADLIEPSTKECTPGVLGLACVVASSGKPAAT